MKKLVLVLTALMVSGIASAKSFNLTLLQPTMVGAVQLRPGEYKVDFENSKAVIRNSKQSVEAEVKVETSDSKFNSTSIRYKNGDGKLHIEQIQLGGTTTRLVFN